MRILFCENTVQGRGENRAEGRAETPFLQGVCDPALAKELRRAEQSYANGKTRATMRLHRDRARREGGSSARPMPSGLAWGFACPRLAAMG